MTDILNLAIVNWHVMLLILVTFCITFIQWKMYKNASLLKTFLSFPRLPVIGSTHLVFGDARTRFKKAVMLFKELERPIVFWVFHIPVICLGKREYIMQTMNKNQYRDTLGAFESIFGDGIMLARGERWRYIRHIMNQAFTPTMLKKYLRVFNEQSIIMTQHLEKEANTGIHIDLYDYAINSSIDVITENMLDYKLKSQGSKKNGFSDALAKILAIEANRVAYPILCVKVFFKVYLYLCGYKKHYTTVREFPKKIVEEKVREFNKMKKIGGFVEGKTSKTLIDILLSIHDQQPDFDQHRMTIEILNMIFTGSESTATTLSFVCLVLAMHPEVQEKVYHEILHVFKDGSVEVKMEHCIDLRYMEQCIKETLRRFSLIPITCYRCSEPTKLNDKQVIPAHFPMLFVFHAVHKDPSVYPDPEKYDPERFSPQNSEHNAQHFMGFGVGHRSCIGAKYAMLSLKTQLVHILRKYRLTTDMRMSDIAQISDISSHCENGYKIKIYEREK